MNAVPEIDYDHNSPEYAAHWHEIHDALRSRCPVAYSPHYGGFYVITRYDDVAAAIKDDQTFTSTHRPGTELQGIIMPEMPTVSTPIEMDPPESTPYRKLMNKHFSKASAETWAPWLRDVTTALVDDFIGERRVDLVYRFASPLPAMLTAKFLGLPMEEWRLYSDSSHDIVRVPPTSPEFPAVIERHQQLLQHVIDTVRQRRVEPKDDVISAFLELEIDGAEPSDERMMEIAALIIGGGNDTTTGLFANAFAWLAEHPEQRALLRDEPERIGPACEEFLRINTPVQAFARTVTRDVEFAGHSFRRGDRVLLSFASANFDPEAFEDPYEVRLDRFPNRHQSFGLGVHRCSGSNFTRVQFRIGLEHVLGRLGDYTVDHSASARYQSVGIVNGWHRLTVDFEPGPVVGSGAVL